MTTSAEFSVFEHARRMRFFPTARQAEHIDRAAVREFERRLQQRLAAAQSEHDREQAERLTEAELPGIVEQAIRSAMSRAERVRASLPPALATPPVARRD